MTTKLLSLMLIFCLMAGLSGCALGEAFISSASSIRGEAPPGGDGRTRAPDEPPEEPIEPEPVPFEPEEDPVETLLSSMSLREKVGQLFVAYVESLCFDPKTGKAVTTYVTSVSDKMKEAYEAYPCGGFCLLSQNVKNKAQFTALTETLHSLGRIRPLLSIDEEGGRVRRLSGYGDFGIAKIPAMETVGNSGDPDRAFETGATMGRYLSLYDIDLDFAPVADINTNPKNRVIGDRAFGSDPAAVSLMVAAACEGLQSEGVMCCIKHFPGHGDTTADTHTGYAETKKTWEEMLSCELLPFNAGIEAGANFVMAAHISAPAFTGDKTPASLSYVLLTEKLRGELGYDGVIITDALSMGAITKKYTS
ncbi:MAG: glycoside hydrolase family 3 protein, partial [Firmicutes bacterium]|nr:glycoside hydrolase family 3 protein [Bacillota bacterium]